MQAKVHDHLVVESKSDAVHRREGEIVEVRGPDGSPPYLVRWEDGHESVAYPGPDARIVQQR